MLSDASHLDPSRVRSGVSSADVPEASVTLLEERGGVIGHAPSGEKARPGSSMPSRSSSGVATSSVGAEGQTGSAARLIPPKVRGDEGHEGWDSTATRKGAWAEATSESVVPSCPELSPAMSARQPQGTFRALSPQALIASLEAEAYGTWQQAFAEVYGR